MTSLVWWSLMTYPRPNPVKRSEISQVEIKHTYDNNTWHSQTPKRYRESRKTMIPDIYSSSVYYYLQTQSVKLVLNRWIHFYRNLSIWLIWFLRQKDFNRINHWQRLQLVLNLFSNALGIIPNYFYLKESRRWPSNRLIY